MEQVYQFKIWNIQDITSIFIKPKNKIFCKCQLLWIPNFYFKVFIYEKKSTKMCVPVFNNEKANKDLQNIKAI